jgi:hypothetical protein
MLILLSKDELISWRSFGADNCKRSPSLARHEDKIKPVLPSRTVICPELNATPIQLPDGETAIERTVPQMAFVTFHSLQYLNVRASIILILLSAVPANTRQLGDG